jgi:hypothetical protein
MVRSEIEKRNGRQIEKNNRIKKKDKKTSP